MNLCAYRYDHQLVLIMTTDEASLMITTPLVKWLMDVETSL